MKDNKNNEPFLLSPIQGAKRNAHRQRSMWTFKEMLRYTFFLHDLIEDGKYATSSALRKEDYKVMARCINTRNSNQCRIFHLKMAHIFGHVEAILKFFKGNIELYQQYHQKYEQILHKQDNSNFTIPETAHSEPLLPIVSSPIVEKKHLQDISEEPLAVSSSNLEGINFIDAYSWIDEVNAFIATFQHNWLEQDI